MSRGRNPLHRFLIQPSLGQRPTGGAPRQRRPHPRCVVLGVAVSPVLHQHRPILHLPTHWPWPHHWLALRHNTIRHSLPPRQRASTTRRTARPERTGQLDRPVARLSRPYPVDQDEPGPPSLNDSRRWTGAKCRLRDLLRARTISGRSVGGRRSERGDVIDCGIHRDMKWLG
jgi:hypothetical protein